MLILRWPKFSLACGLEFRNQVSSLVSIQTRICEGSILFAGRLCLGSLGYLVIKTTAGESLQGVLFWFGAPHFERVLDTAPQWVKKGL